jgi:hypothetical protein
MAWTQPDTPGFFAGHNAASIGVVAFNIAVGFACVAVYKYDSVMNALAASLTTVLTIMLSWAFYGLVLNPINASGCVIVVVSVLMYTQRPNNCDPLAVKKAGRCRFFFSRTDDVGLPRYANGHSRSKVSSTQSPSIITDAEERTFGFWWGGGPQSRNTGLRKCFG